MFLCDDFERAMTNDGRWDAIEQEGGATLAISPAFKKEGVSALGVTLPDGADEGRRALLVKSFPVGTRRITVRFWLHAVTIPTTDILLTDTLTENGHVWLMLQNGNLVVAGEHSSGSPSAGESHTPFVVGKDYEIVFDYRTALGPSKVVVLVDNAKLDLAVSNANGGGDPKSFEIGATFARVGGAASYFIDEVSIDKSP